MVEVFCTDVDCAEKAQVILGEITKHFPHYDVNFDLEDCDRILRVSSSDSINHETILFLLKSNGVRAEILAG